MSSQEMKAQCQSSDRLSALPQEPVEKILTMMPIRDALRTSVLSRKWRYSWTGIPKLVFDDSLFASSNDEDIDQYKFVKAIFHVLLLHRAPILEFSLSFNTEISSEIDQMILHLSRSNNIKKFILETNGSCYPLPYAVPCLFFSLQELEHIDLSYCTLLLPSMNKGFRMLKSLRLHGCYFCTNEMVFGFLTNCPLLEEFNWTSDDRDIELSGEDLVELFKCLPSVQFLKIWMLHIMHLDAGTMPHKLPISLVHLKILDLTLCFLELASVQCVISSSPNLEKMRLEMCSNHGEQCFEKTSEKLHDLQDYTSLNLDYFKELEITRFRDCGCWMEFVKLVMGRSPMLKKATIELCSSVSVDKEVHMFQDLVRMPFPRASPTANLIIKRPKNYRR